MDNNPENTTDTLVDPASEKDHILGPMDAPLTLLEYGDYECPDCLNAVPIVKEVRRALGDRLRFVFRHFPLSSIHPHASIAAEAAEAAGDQGKFWEMHEALFRHQKELADLTHIALTLGMEVYAFETDRSADRHRKKVYRDYEGGVLSGVKGTPTFFVNGCRYRGPKETKAIIASCERAVNNEGK